MKKQLTTQTERFNARLAKAKADKQVENRAIEERITEEMQQKQSLYNVIGVLERSVSLLTNEVRSLRRENDELQAVRRENAEMKGMMGQIMVELEEIRKVTVGSLYMDDKKKMELGMNFYTSPLHRYRAQQIKEKGYFEDPKDPKVLAHLGIFTGKNDDHEAVEEVIEETPTPVSEPSVVKTPVATGYPRGRRPARVIVALEYIATYTRESGRYDWRKGGIELIFAMLTVSEWRGVDIRNTARIQTDVESRKAFQQVTYNLDRYGVKNWAELIAKFEEAN